MTLVSTGAAEARTHRIITPKLFKLFTNSEELEELGGDDFWGFEPQPIPPILASGRGAERKKGNAPL